MNLVAPLQLGGVGLVRGLSAVHAKRGLQLDPPAPLAQMEAIELSLNRLVNLCSHARLVVVLGLGVPLGGGGSLLDLHGRCSSGSGFGGRRVSNFRRRPVRRQHATKPARHSLVERCRMYLAARRAVTLERPWRRLWRWRSMRDLPARPSHALARTLCSHACLRRHERGASTRREPGAHQEPLDAAPRGLRRDDLWALRVVHILRIVRPRRRDARRRC